MAVLARNTFRIHPEGTFDMTFKEVEQRRFKSQFPDGPDGMAARLRWVFVSDEMDDQGVRYELVHLTPTSISSRNRVGELARMMVPGLDPDRDAFDPEELMGRRFRVMVANRLDAGGTMRDSLVSIKPIDGRKAAPAPAAASAPKVDVFGDV